jgi:arginyl-tRNA synthetase
MSDSRAAIQAALEDALRRHAPQAGGAVVVVERPKQAAHGDYASSAALAAARAARRNPRELAAAIAADVGERLAGLVAPPQVAGPGFINFTLLPPARQSVVHDVLQRGEHYGRSETGRGQRVMIEFVSANPTGPLHVGHGRQAALGDALANLMQWRGTAVTREYYYNDAGEQINNLAVSVRARAREILGESGAFPESGYHGEYIR